MVNLKHPGLTRVVLNGTRESHIMVNLKHPGLTRVVLNGTRESELVTPWYYNRNPNWDSGVSDYGELDMQLPDKRNAKNSDTDWDADYGWGGGRFGKRRDATGRL